MSARVVVVHDEPEFAGQLVSALRLAGYDVTAFADPFAAWDVLSEPQRIDVVVTGVVFPPSSNGVALARKVNIARPEIRVLFMAPLELSQATARLGTFMDPPVTVPAVVQTVVHLLNFELTAVAP